ncbi:ABC transporter permease [Nonomuraea sp. NPDC048826]|uniref:ABC transporter permease n=1 Tax=Nonomuraea sp. NPDC048826 TaxID=3364347 RepID=UPI0037101A32
MANLARDAYLLAGRRSRHLLRAPGKLISVTLNPLIMLFTIGYLFAGSILVPSSGDYLEFIMAGIAAQVALTSVAPSSLGMAMELRDGLIERLRSLPTSPFAVLLGYTLSELLLAVTGLFLVSGVGSLMGWRTRGGFADTLTAFALIVVFIYAMIWVGVLLGLAVRAPEVIGPIAALVLIVPSFLSNAFLSVTGLPGWARVLAEWNPVSALVTLCRRLWGTPTISGSSLPELYPGALLCVSLVALFATTITLSLRAYSRIVTP